MAADEFCIRVCKEGPNAAMWCQHIYDTMGYAWNMSRFIFTDALQLSVGHAGQLRRRLH